MDIGFLLEADKAAFSLETAKRQLEVAKSQLEAAKLIYDDVLSQAEDHGIPKAKLKKLIDERAVGVFESGLIELAGAPSPAKETTRAEKPKRQKKNADPAGASAADEERAAVGSSSDLENSAEDSAAAEDDNADTLM